MKVTIDEWGAALVEAAKKLERRITFEELMTLLRKPVGELE
jgi:hypothetical protein